MKDRDCEFGTGWISTTDALPCPLQNVIICTDINTVTVAWINGDHWIFADTGNGHLEEWSFDDVKYWMPLPEPPKMSQLKASSNQLDSLEQRVDELSEEYDAVLKTHGDTLEDHMERITINEGNIDAISSDVEDLQVKVAAIYQFISSAAPGTFFNIMEEIKRVEKENVHNGSNFCGNCTHAKSSDGICTCRLNKGIIDPDDSSCEWFEPPF